MTYSLRNRVAKLEVIRGDRAPSEHEFVDAVRLISTHFEAIHAPEIFGCEANPAEVLLMKAAEAAGEIAAAEDVRRRYYRAKGLDIEAEGRQRGEEVLASLTELFADVARQTEGRVTDLGASEQSRTAYSSTLSRIPARTARLA